MYLAHASEGWEVHGQEVTPAKGLLTSSCVEGVRGKREKKKKGQWETGSFYKNPTPSAPSPSIITLIHSRNRGRMT